MKNLIKESLLESSEYDGLDPYKQEVLKFIDYPWQEDTEIEFTSLLDQYRDQILSSSSEFIKDYLQRMNATNGDKLSWNCSDAFLGAWEDLLK